MDSSTFSNFRPSSHSIPLSQQPYHRLQFSPNQFLVLLLSINFFLLFFSFLLIIIFFQKFKRLGLVKNRLIARSTSGSDQSDAGGSLNGIQLTPNKLFLQEVTVLFYSFFCFKLC
jgi:4-hydroxybenzoate polyprenyltransferase